MNAPRLETSSARLSAVNVLFRKTRALLLPPTVRQRKSVKASCRARSGEGGGDGSTTVPKWKYFFTAG